MPRRLASLVPYALSFYTSASLMTLELVASRLVAQHVGASLVVWTSVIGVILAGICLGNVLGGRLADRVEPGRILGPLYAVGAALTAGILWLNVTVGFLPGATLMPWTLRTLLVVALDFLVPATVLGMISPVVAKLAVEQSRRTGSAIGDIYFLGAVGSILGTFLTGFYLLYLAPTSVIVAIVAASLALLAALLSAGAAARLSSLAAALLLGGGAAAAIWGWPGGQTIAVGSLRLNPILALGHVAALVMGVIGLLGWLGQARAASPDASIQGHELSSSDHSVSLTDLCVLAFIASLGFMALEMVAGRLVTRHLGSSIYGWTSVIGVLLGGLSLGNYLGGKLADHIKGPHQAAALFLAASVMVLAIIVMEHPPSWLVKNPIAHYFGGQPAEAFGGRDGEFLSEAIGMVGYPWWFRVLFWTGVVFFVPALTMGTVSPVVAKLAVDRLKSSKRTGTAIGTVYAWGMVGSLAGTFLAGFLLIDVLGTKGVILAISCLMALAATTLGSTWHAAWAGVPLGLCIMAFVPSLLPGGPVNGDGTGGPKAFLTRLGVEWGLREQPADPDDPESEIAYIDESNYYFIKVNNAKSGDNIRRTLVLDNLIHGYFILGKPGQLDYDYEHIYALVTDRAHRARSALPDGVPRELGTLFLGGGSYTFPRYLQATYPRTWAEVAEIDPAVTRANHAALGLPRPQPRFPEPSIHGKTGEAEIEVEGKTVSLGPPNTDQARTAQVEALSRIAPPYQRDPSTNLGFVMLDGERHTVGPHGTPESYESYLELVRSWYETSKYRIRTTWGDARQYVVKSQGERKFQVVFGDAFNDFSVPWHLTTLEFNERINGLLANDGIYMINIIDVYESDWNAAREAPRGLIRAAVVDLLRTRWKGVKEVPELAGELTSALTAETEKTQWTELAGWTERGLRDAPQARSQAEMIEAIRSRRHLERTWLAPLTLGVESATRRAANEEDIQGIAEQILAIARTDDLIAEWKTLYSETDRRYRAQPPSTLVMPLVGLAFEQLGPDNATFDSWQAQMTGVLERLEQALVALATFRGDTVKSLNEAVERSNSEILDLLTEKKINALTARFALSALATIRIEFRPRIEAAAADPLLQRSLLEDSTGELALVLDEIRSIRDAFADRIKPIRERTADDLRLSHDVAQVIESGLSQQDEWLSAIVKSVQQARTTGGFLGAWVNTARRTFPHIYVFGTDRTQGRGVRETFVVVASRRPLDLTDLGRRDGDPQFFTGKMRTEPELYGPSDMEALELRARGIVLTDDYAPVENLLAPVAATRGND